MPDLSPPLAFSPISIPIVAMFAAGVRGMVVLARSRSDSASIPQSNIGLAGSQRFRRKNAPAGPSWMADRAIHEFAAHSDAAGAYPVAQG